MDSGDGGPRPPARVRRRDRHGRGLRGVLAPPEVPVHRTRAERFDDLVLEAVARLEPRWESQLAGIEFAVEEIPPPVAGEAAAGEAAAGEAAGGEVAGGEAQHGTVPLGRLDPGSPAVAGSAPSPAGGLQGGPPGSPPRPRPPRIVVYRRPLLARADGEEDLGELVFDVVVEEFARLLGVDPEDIDPEYGDGD